MKSGILEIYHNEQLVNSMTFEGENQVNYEIAKICISKEVRGTKTKFRPIPYTDEIKIDQYFYDEVLGTYKYKYHFKGVK